MGPSSAVAGRRCFAAAPAGPVRFTTRWVASATMTATTASPISSPVAEPAIEHDWGWWGRPNQQEPKGDWRTWLLLAGRGFGKTRSGAECICDQGDDLRHRPTTIEVRQKHMGARLAKGRRHHSVRTPALAAPTAALQCRRALPHVFEMPLARHRLVRPSGASKVTATPSRERRRAEIVASTISPPLLTSATMRSAL
jgi:phage terminase large subunit-like protein